MDPRLSDDQWIALFSDLNEVVLDAGEARAAVAVARQVNAAIARGADTRITLDETPWSFDTLRSLTAEPERDPK